MLIGLFGLPAAGKSTFADRLGKTLDEAHGVKVMTIASDTVRDEIYTLRRIFDPDLEPAVRQMTLDRIESALLQGLSVIHDDLNYYRSMRFELVNLARRVSVPLALIHITTPVEACLKFNEARGRKIPDEVIVKDGSRMDAPGEDPWDMPFAAVEAPGLVDEEVGKIATDLLVHAARYEPWVPPIKAEHVATRMEELDLLARRVVGELYRTGKPEADGKEISGLRLELVRRACEDGLPDGAAEAYFRSRLSSLFR